MIRKLRPTDLDSVMEIWPAANLQAHGFVDSGSAMAKMLDFPESVIDVTMTAVGTSLPELFTAKFHRWQGVLMLTGYVGYVIVLI